MDIRVNLMSHGQNGYFCKFLHIKDVVKHKEREIYRNEQLKDLYQYVIA